MNRIHLIIKTNLTVFSFPCISKFQKTRTKKRNKEVAALLAILETPIYDYIQNMSIYVHISFFVL